LRGPPRRRKLKALPRPFLYAFPKASLLPLPQRSPYIMDNPPRRSAGFLYRCGIRRPWSLSGNLPGIVFFPPVMLECPWFLPSPFRTGPKGFFLIQVAGCGSSQVTNFGHNREGIFFPLHFAYRQNGCRPRCFGASLFLFFLFLWEQLFAAKAVDGPLTPYGSWPFLPGYNVALGDGRGLPADSTFRLWYALSPGLAGLWPSFSPFFTVFRFPQAYTAKGHGSLGRRKVAFLIWGWNLRCFDFNQN